MILTRANFGADILSPNFVCSFLFLDGYNDDDDDDDCVAQCHREQRARQDLLSQPTITAAH